ncbi:DUF5808 domain-containing protein [Pseudonocardia sp. GCM10023141]|uniref:DUF5808 domain-containing protein n=1 Tax=Pseudonocardia sp. GCM10023141 TaxID=3252653 RepID=UPI00360ED53F
MAARLNRIVMLSGVAAVGLAVAQELRKPAEQREWHGTLGGLVPYDLRPPTASRLRRAMWNPDEPAVLVPHAFGVGWTVNMAAVAALLSRGRRGA